MALIRYLPRFRRAAREMEMFASRERWSRAEIEMFQLERLNSVWIHATTYVPYYVQLRAAHGLPDRFANLDEFMERMPLLRKSSVQSRKMDFLSARHRRQGGWRVTGGSTGTPTVTYRSKEAHLEMLRSRYRFHAMWGVDFSDRMVFLWGHCASFAPGIQGWLQKRIIPFEDRLRNRLRLSAYHMDRETLQRYVAQIAAFRPAGIYAYSMAGFLLAVEAEEVGFQCDSLKFVNLTAEPAPLPLVRRCEQAFGVPAIIEYGSVECGFLAGEWPDRTLRVREDLALLETLPRNDGRYDIVVTVLNNPDFPLLRYAIGDITDQPLEKPESGFAILTNVSGRNNDVLVSLGGHYIHADAIVDVLEDIPDLRRYHLHQHADGSIVLKIEAPQSPTRQVEKAVRRLREMLEGCPIETQHVERIPQTPAGKHRFVVSELAPERQHSPLDQ